jgi:hypothetical protein
MGERIAGRIHIVQSKICILLQDMNTNISLHKHRTVLLFYLFMVYYLILLLFTYSPYPANISYYSLAVFTTTLTEISHIKNKKKISNFSINVKIFQSEFYLTSVYLNYTFYTNIQNLLGAAQKHSEGRELKTPDVAHTLSWTTFHFKIFKFV